MKARSFFMGFRATDSLTDDSSDDSEALWSTTMIWRCFSYDGVGSIYLIIGITYQFGYIKTLEEVMLPYAVEEMLLKWAFQQKHDSKHTSKQQHLGPKPTRSTLQRDHLDLDPAEDWWTDIIKAVSEQKPRNTDIKCNPVVLDWDTCPQVTEAGGLHEHRCEEVLRNRGSTTEY